MAIPHTRPPRILLTGSTGTLGRETALALVRTGAELLLPVRNPAKATQLHNLLNQACPNASMRFFFIDMADENSILSLARQLCKENLPLDAIIHNAGVFTCAGATTSHATEWHQQVNAYSPFLLTQALLPVLLLSPCPTVITVTSMSAFWIKIHHSKRISSPTKLYARSKRHLLLMMRAFSRQYPTIRFLYAHPGVCATGLFNSKTHQSAYHPVFLRFALPVMKLLFPCAHKACRPILTALHSTDNRQLAEPSGMFHIWGKPRLIPLSKRLK